MENKARLHDAISEHQPVALENPESITDLDLDIAEMLKTAELSRLGISAEGLSDFPSDQAYEFITAASIYSSAGDRFERIMDLRSPWQTVPDLAFAFSITSAYSADFNARLQFQLPMRWPKVPLKANLLHLRPVHDSELMRAVDEAMKTAPQQRYPGEHETRYEGHAAVVDAILACLDTSAINYENGLKGKSLASMRAEDKAMQQRHDEAQKQREMDQRIAESIAQEERLKEKLQWEKNRRHNPDSFEPGQEEDEDERLDDELVSEIPFRFHNTITIASPRNATDLQFRAVFGPGVLLKRPDKIVTIVHPVKLGRMYAESLLLKEIFIPDKVAKYKGQIEQAMDEIRHTLEDCKAHPHPNIMKIYAFQIEHDEEDRSMPEWKVSILSEFATDGSLMRHLIGWGALHAAVVRRVGEQVLKALVFIEQQQHIHPALHPDNVFLFLDEHNVSTYKVADGYGTTLGSLVRSSRENGGIVAEVVNGWTAPELATDPLARTTKTCIWEFGLLLVKMGFLSGHEVESVLTSPEKLLRRDDLDPHFLRVLQSCFQPAARRRPSAFDLLSHPFFKDGSKDLNIPTKENPGRVPHLLRTGHIADTTGSAWSANWSHDNVLGQGGFGEVIRARNKHDGQYYAVKRIVPASKQDLDEMWAEVKLLAQLSHPGIVRYHSAWQEEEFDEEDYVNCLENVGAESAHRVRPNVTYEKNTAPDAASSQLSGDVGLSMGQDLSMGHDFMDPSQHRLIGPEFDTESEDGNLFGYQSGRSDSDDADLEIGFEASESLSDDGMPQQRSGISDSGNIQFGDETSSRNLPQTEPSIVPSSSPSPVRRVFSRREPLKKVVLYIQMELCEEETLADSIKRRLPYNMDEVWRLFRQILDALKHIHEHGIVHRDLKPANIFLVRGNIKIGDFGLAIPGRPNGAEIERNTRTAVLRAGTSSRGVGTKFYTAPELETGGSGVYSTKADMFSLGVIFFQMCYPMATATERMNQLRKISEQVDYQLPNYFHDEGYHKQATLIAKLINHNQDERPSAEEIIRGGYLPETIERDALERYLGTLAEDDPDQYQRFIDKAFKLRRHCSRTEELAYVSMGTQPHNKAKRTTDPRVTENVDISIKQVFERRGAVRSDRQIPVLVNDFYLNAAEYMDSRGRGFQLPYDLTLPFAIMLAYPAMYELTNEHGTRPDFHKYYSFGTIYRKGLYPDSPPICTTEIDYDVVSSNAKTLSVKDAEVIEALDAVIQQQPGLAHRPTMIYINHGDLLDIILDFCRIPKSTWDDVKRTLSYIHVSNTGWPEIRTTLIAQNIDLSESALKTLAIFKAPGGMDDIRRVLKKVFDEEYLSRAARPLNRLDEIVKYLQRMGITIQVQISLLSNQSEQLYRGSIMFQCVDTRAKSILAVGGRYDKLIEYYQPPGQQKGLIRAVGFRIKSQTFYAHAYNVFKTRIAAKSKPTIRELNSLLPPRLDAVVTSFDAATLRGRCVDVVKDLHASGIKAEISEHFTNLEALYAAYDDPITFCVVIVRPGTSDKRPLKVRTPSREEKEVGVFELVATIKAEISGQTFTPAVEPKLRKMASTHGESTLQDRVKFVTPKHGNKKFNRAAVREAVGGAAQEFLDTLSASAIVVAFAPKSDDVLHAIRNTRLSDGESWRSMKQVQTPVERGYIQSVQDELLALSEQGHQGAFLVNYLTTTCAYYDFGKMA